MYLALCILLYSSLHRTVSDSRMRTFFANDFTQERWRKAALKNAFALLGKQRFEHAAAFFLLADKLWDAVEVCVSRLGDLQLAFVITRLYEGDGGPVYERLLKECILGIGTSDTTTLNHQLETNPDPFLRSIACWLLQDYSGALETLLLTPESVVRGKDSGRSGHGLELDNSNGHIPDPAIFNFYFFLRSHPLLLRRDYRLRGSKSLFQTQQHSSSSPLTGVGDEPFTPAERNLLFSTAYHHLSHGCPLLALDVLSKLPKSCSLGAEVCSTCSKETPAETSRGGGFKSAKHAVITVTDSITGMIQSGTLTNSFAFGDETSPTKPAADDIDWSQPVSSQIGSSDDFDWSQPVTSQLGDRAEPEDEFDWSKPVSSQISLTGNLGNEGEEDIDWSQPVSKLVAMEEKERESPGSEEGGHSKSTFSTQGLFILSLAEQLQYNACLSILTEELNTIFIPACCKYLLEKRGKDALPLFPLARKANDNNLAAHYRENAFEKTVLSLRGMLVEWLRSETEIVKEICGFEMVVQDLDDVPENYTPAGYDLLTTLMNYVALHAATTPTLLTIKLELMHLVNTLLPWSTGLSQIVQDFESEVLPSGPTCAVDPAQLPILTSCSLPAKHLTNLAIHLRMMSASIVEILATHTCPPIASKPLPHVREVFDLCCAISHCVTVCLSPMRLAEMAGGMAAANQSKTSVQGEQQKTPQMFRRVPSGGTPPTRPRSGSGFTSLDFLQSIDKPNTKPSKWPGVAQWPSTLSSDEGKDPTPLSLILVECCVAVYLGLLSVAWSWHSISDLQLLVENAPSQAMWYSTFGGGVDVKKADERGKRSGSQTRSIFMQTVSHTNLCVVSFPGQNAT